LLSFSLHFLRVLTLLSSLGLFAVCIPCLLFPNGLVLSHPVMYNNPKWRCFRLEHLDMILLNWSLWVSRFLFSRKSSSSYKLIHIWW
jgi:hypothetical protein